VNVNSGAVWGEDHRYRYALWRIWDEAVKPVMFIGLNPSTADEHHDDPTLRRCIGYAQDWGYGGLYMLNLFAYRATDPKVLLATPDPVGPEADLWLRKMAQRSACVVAAWGNHGTYLARNEEVCLLFPTLYCLKVNKSGQPSHPLYLPRGLEKQVYQIAT